MQQPHIGGQHADAVAVMPGQVGADQVIGDLGGLRLGAAHAGGDQVGDGVERLRRECRHGRIWCPAV